MENNTEKLEKILNYNIDPNEKIDYITEVLIEIIKKQDKRIELLENQMKTKTTAPIKFKQ